MSDTELEVDSASLAPRVSQLAMDVNACSKISSLSESELRKYDVTRNGRKLAVVINIKDFSGSKNVRIPKKRFSEVDEKVITNMLNDTLGFEIITKHDCTLKDLVEFFQELQIWEYGDVDTMAIVLMSYGDNTVIYTSDGEIVPIKQLLENLKGNNCPGLAGKPKIIFINAGPWEESLDDLGYDEVDSSRSAEESIVREKKICVPKECDFIHVYSPVMTGHQKTGALEQGNIFLTALYEMCLKLQGEQLEFCDLLTRTNRQVAVRVSSASKVPARPCFFLSTLTKELYLLARS